METRLTKECAVNTVYGAFIFSTLSFPSFLQLHMINACAHCIVMMCLTWVNWIYILSALFYLAFDSDYSNNQPAADNAGGEKPIYNCAIMMHHQMQESLIQISNLITWSDACYTCYQNETGDRIFIDQVGCCLCTQDLLCTISLLVLLDQLLGQLLHRV